MSAKQPTPPPGEPGYTGPKGQVRPDPPPAPPRKTLDDETTEALRKFYVKLAASQRDLPADHAKVLNDNRWDLYE